MQKNWVILLLIMTLVANSQTKPMSDAKRYNQMALTEIDDDIRQISEAKITNQARMIYYSERFLNTPYEAACEGEGENGLYEPQPVLNLKNVNCMTFCEIVLALSLSRYYEEFFNVLQHIRYRNGIISMATRNHYTMADWLPANEWCLQDVTKKIGSIDAVDLTRTISHQNFFKKKGIANLPQMVKDRNVTIQYIPLNNLVEHENEMHSGDIAVLIQNKPDIFAAHMLLVIVKEGKLYFRHADKNASKVQDVQFQEYILGLTKNSLYQGMSFMRVKERIDWQFKNATHGKIILP